MEEIVGDIRDEFDKDETKRRHTSITPFVKDSAEADGDVDIDELNRKLNLNLPEGPDYNSLAGFMIAKLGHMPAVDESVEAEGVRLTVLASDERRVKTGAHQQVAGRNRCGSGKELATENAEFTKHQHTVSLSRPVRTNQVCRCNRRSTARHERSRQS